uniref:Uncharacterized protein n=1 Tax=Anopheles atroparvus TaxID=41427 RepID=A0AAG5DMY8_ANOAO
MVAGALAGATLQKVCNFVPRGRLSHFHPCTVHTFASSRYTVDFFMMPSRSPLERYFFRSPSSGTYENFFAALSGVYRYIIRPSLFFLRAWFSFSLFWDLEKICAFDAPFICSACVYEIVK